MKLLLIVCLLPWSALGKPLLFGGTGSLVKEGGFAIPITLPEKIVAQVVALASPATKTTS